MIRVAAPLLVLTAAAWALTGGLMAGMDAGPGTPLGDLGWFAGVWVVMMAAMMLPAVAPAALARARAEADREASAGPPGLATAAFLGGYLAAWTVAGVAGYAAVELVRSLDPEFLAWSEAGAYVAGGVLLVAALYQLTTWKGSFLGRCRRTAELFDRAWRPGALGALRMGIAHGALCIGCCWALMAALFALGVMSIGWMALVAILIAGERLLPWERIPSRGVAAVLAVLAIAVAFAPGEVPGLTIPGSPEAMEAMEAMGMGEMEGEDPSMRGRGGGPMEMD